MNLIVFVVYIILKTKISSLLCYENSTNKHDFSCVILREVYGITVFPIDVYIHLLLLLLLWLTNEIYVQRISSKWLHSSVHNDNAFTFNSKLSVLKPRIDINCLIIDHECLSSLTLWFSSNSQNLMPTNTIETKIYKKWFKLETPPLRNKQSPFRH